MKKIILLLIIFTTFNLFATEYSATFDIKSNYNWRDLKINDTPVFQPYSTLSDSDIHSPDYFSDDSEIVYGISYSISF